MRKFKISEPIDVILDNLVKNKRLNIYWCNPALFKQGLVLSIRILDNNNYKYIYENIYILHILICQNILSYNLNH